MIRALEFALHFFNLGIFWYYLKNHAEPKEIHRVVRILLLMGLAVIWTMADAAGIPHFSLAAMIGILVVTTFLIQSSVFGKVSMVISFVGLGVMAETMRYIIFQQCFAVRGGPVEGYLACLMDFMAYFLRGNIVYLICKVQSRNDASFSGTTGEMAGELSIVFTGLGVVCCFFIDIAFQTGIKEIINMCIGIVASCIMLYFFMLYLIDYYGYILMERHENQRYIDEMRHKEMYYNEMDKRNEYVENLKHDIKNKILGLVHLMEKGDVEIFTEKLKALCMDLELADEEIYSHNPVVNSVLRVKIGMAKLSGIRVETSVHVPKKMRLDYGDIGVLYGNLLDNAIEACLLLDEEKRFIELENKYIDGKLILIITNSKPGKINKDLHTTKQDKKKHGRGISSANRVVEKYNGFMALKDKGEIFCVSVILYNV